MALATLGLTLWLASMAEDLVRTRIESAARRHGMVVQIQGVHVGVWPLLRLDGVALDLGQGLNVQAESTAVTWLGQWRLAVRGVHLTGPAGLELRSALSRWKVEGLLDDELRLTLRAPSEGLTLRRQTAPTGDTWTVEARELDVDSLLELRRDGLALVANGILDGQLAVYRKPDEDRLHLDLRLRGARLGPQPGEPTHLALKFDATRQPARGTIEIPAIHASAGSADLAGSLSIRGLGADPVMDLALAAKQLDFVELLGMAALEVPERLQLPAGGKTSLGVAAMDVQVSGRLAEPATLVVTQKIQFTPPRDMPRAITALRGDFHFRANEGTGRGRSIHVSPESPDFVPLAEVPPLFIRALTLAEDTDFYGHRGIDLREMPAALATNWSRGTAARGGSTISQQLAKNLFLSRDKQVGRKLQEVPVTFLLESALGKRRILEIYLNIIEWGPELRGLRPAARHYFGREPAALTPAEMAFLVSIIPGPILYQRSFADGTPGPGLRAMVNTLLAKLRSVDALSEEEYQLALADPLVIGADNAGS